MKHSQDPRLGLNPAYTTQSIQVNRLSVEFSTGQRPDGEWFALGTVREVGKRFDGFPWVVIGTGTSPDEAINELRTKVSQASGVVAR